MFGLKWSLQQKQPSNTGTVSARFICASSTSTGTLSHKQMVTVCSIVGTLYTDIKNGTVLFTVELRTTDRPLASRLLCNRQISKDEVRIADALLMQFCHLFEVLYRPQAVTPNIHLHAHLADCIEDYGLMSDFWLFSLFWVMNLQLFNKGTIN